MKPGDALDPTTRAHETLGPIELAIVAALREVARRKAERRATLTVVDGGRKAA